METKTRREKRKKKRSISGYFDKRYLKSLWDEHWEIIITVILGLIVGVFILPTFFR
jgi:LPS O-antigen subunit length determinant protein (WzzB/FepE family)